MYRNVCIQAILVWEFKAGDIRNLNMQNQIGNFKQLLLVWEFEQAILAFLIEKTILI